MNSPDENRLRQKVEEYCSKYAIEPPFEISDVVNIQNVYKGGSWPFGDAPGCYIFYCEAVGLLYIGKASNSSAMAHRLGTYFRTRGLPVVEPRHKWTRPPVHVQTVKVHEAYQAPSLEEFLIRELKPVDNVI